jgi:hypothetical protein
MTDEHPVLRRSTAQVAGRRSEDPLATDRIVRELNAVCKAATFEFSLAVGELVIRRLYSGDVGRFRSRGRKGHAALRKLATHPALAMSPSMLYRCIAIYELCERVSVRSWKHVSTSHLRLVLSLEPDEQARLLSEAEANRWPVRRLEEAVVASTKGRPRLTSRGGRPRRSPLRKAIKMLQRDLATIADLLRSEDAVETSPESTRAADSMIRRAADTCAVVRMALTAAAWSADP